jgi:hypothetical protein
MKNTDATVKPEPGEYEVSAGVWVQTERLTDGSLVFNVWMRNHAPRVRGNGEDRVRFAVEPKSDDWVTWAEAVDLARQLAQLTDKFCDWSVA